MRIKVNDKNKCTNCTHRTCSMNDIIIKSDYNNLKTEQYTCPVKLLEYGLTQEQLEAGYVDLDKDKNVCVHCYLCVMQCSQNNLKIENYTYDIKEDFSVLVKSGEFNAQGPSNVIALSYLNRLFAFAANTNLIRMFKFDGAVLTKTNKRCLVEVDIGNDSLECCRRLLADIVLYNHQNDHKVNDGLMVLNDFPKEGSNEVITVIEKIKNFQATDRINIYITTFSLLRYFALNSTSDMYEYDDLLFNASVDLKKTYLEKLLYKKLVDSNTIKQIF